MARPFTLAQIRTRARRLADMENTQFVSDAEVTDLVNEHYGELYDLLVKAGPPDYFAATNTFVTTPGVAQTALQIDFRNITTVYVQETNFQDKRQVRPLSDGSISGMRPPLQAYTIIVEYVPSPAVLASDSDTIDGVSGWEALIVKMVARDLLRKEESDTQELAQDIAALKQRIRSSSHRGPRVINDVEATYGFPYSSRICGYRLRAGNIELYERITGWP
jgi:hypothetical protein